MDKFRPVEGIIDQVECTNWVMYPLGIFHITVVNKLFLISVECF